MNLLKKILPDVLMVLLFAVISVGYFYNATTNGLVLTGDDHNAALGCTVETNDYQQRTGEISRWNNSLFSGMPTYQMAPSYSSTHSLRYVQDALKLWLPKYAGYLMLMLIGFYLMLRAFNFRPYLAALGSILWAFSSYYPIIIGAGHIWKLMTLSFIPPTIGGIWLCYRGKYLVGGVVTAVFLTLQITSNHVQMTYYFLIVIAAVALACLYDAWKNREIGQWVKGSMTCVAAGVIAICINVSNLYHTYEYSKETMRSKSELTSVTKDEANQTKDGLERDYITAWSYGIGETWTLLVPDVKGGASKPLSKNETAMKKANPRYKSIYSQLGQYWGEQPGTSGPVYVGAFVLFLFVLGLMIVKGPLKWGLLIATILSVMLSWGKNLMWFTNLFLDYVPMYDKFRTVASILVVAEFTIPLLAMLALKVIVDKRDSWKDEVRVLGLKLNYLSCTVISFCLTGGAALLFCLMPDTFFGGYMSTQEAGMLNEAVQAGQLPADLVVNLQEMRRAMLTSDALRSFIIILVGVAVILIYVKKKINWQVMTAILAVLCLFDLWDVDKRYLSDDMFTRPKAKKEYFKPTEADNYILQDKSHHRVLDFAHNTFNDNTAGYYHHSIGGYHAAKLRRYQELIEMHISREMRGLQSLLLPNDDRMSYKIADEENGMPVLNMLNMKYVILPAKEGTIPAVNPYANGNAWFVDNVRYVDNADDELAALYDINTKHEAVADSRFKAEVGESVAQDSLSHITLTNYEVNALRYEAESEKGGVAVFSEIYYPGWKAVVDGEEVPVGRVNYVLRAINLKPGKHVVEFTFDPQTLHTTEAVAWTAIIILLAGIAWAVVQAFAKRKTNQQC
ncbi:MAG: YfhO family protein [Bacteroidales bacterium]|nr:YfhO family protein [Candidatus Liminaster caballi]